MNEWLFIKDYVNHSTDHAKYFDGFCINKNNLKFYKDKIWLKGAIYLQRNIYWQFWTKIREVSIHIILRPKEIFTQAFFSKRSLLCMLKKGSNIMIRKISLNTRSNNFNYLLKIQALLQLIRYKKDKASQLKNHEYQ